MIILTLIATIIHMNYGFEFIEALGRGVVSAFMVSVLGGVICLVVWGIVALLGYLSKIMK